MRNDELETIGHDWLHLVRLIKQNNLEKETEFVQFRDNDLSIKGGAILGFSGLMIASDLVFISSNDDSLIAPGKDTGLCAYLALAVLVCAAANALLSILISEKEKYETVLGFFGALRIFQQKRSSFLKRSAALTVVGTAMYLIPLSVVILRNLVAR
jgi:hypothetical protein